MPKIKLLIQGYATEINGVESASSATTLIQDGNANVIVDPGMNRKLLLDNLVKEGLKTEDINYVILTHTHLDHSLLVGIFNNAKVFDNSDVYSFDGKISSHNGKIPNTDIEIIKTPGHDQFHCSVLVNTEEFGKVIIAGDVLWWRDGEKQERDILKLVDREDPYVKDEKALKESRKKVLEVADYIIPGHGPMFKVKK
ncbi:MAG: MBL fold metallo-hydrolase [Patescibacteria group bacterium]|nr:MBL fold metallo-hydrolase [Patescibacteria group bacterium]MCL5431993.1 MBL fold metallo-hydrolase [Patescibacteria group bacterium]